MASQLKLILISAHQALLRECLISFYMLEKNKKDGSDEMSVFAYSETSNPNIEVKSRARFFPKRIEFTYENILAALDHAIKGTRQIL